MQECADSITNVTDSNTTLDGKCHGAYLQYTQYLLLHFISFICFLARLFLDTKCLLARFHDLLSLVQPPPKEALTLCAACQRVKYPTVTFRDPATLIQTMEQRTEVIQISSALFSLAKRLPDCA